MCIDCKFGLQVPGQRRSCTNDGTYIKDVEDSDKIRLPSGDLFHVVLRVEISGNHVPSVLLDDLRLDLCHCPE